MIYYKTIIKINHIELNNGSKNIYSLFHLWEHLFVKIIQFSTFKSLDVFGYTNKDSSIITIISTSKLPPSFINKLSYRLYKLKISNKHIAREIVILKTELSFIKTNLYKDLKSYPNYGYNFKSLRRFCKDNFNWNNLNISPNILVNNSNIESYEIQYNSLNNILNKNLLFMLRKFYKNDFSYPQSTHEYNQFLLCFPIFIYPYPIQDFNLFVDFLKTNSFIHLLSTKYHISNIILPKIAIKENQIWFIVYIYTKYTYISFIIQILTESLNSFFKVHKIKSITSPLSLKELYYF